MCIRDSLREHRCTADGFHQREPLVVLGHCPVSYTHLDVYKRQVVGMMAGAIIDSVVFLLSGYGEPYFPGYLVTAVLSGLIYGVMPVSYTHL